MTIVYHDMTNGSNDSSPKWQLWLMNTDGGNQRQLTNFAFAVWDPVWVKYTDQ